MNSVEDSPAESRALPAEIAHWLHGITSEDQSVRADCTRNLSVAVYGSGERSSVAPAVIPHLMDIAGGASHGRGLALELVARLVGGPCSIRTGFSLADGRSLIVEGVKIPPDTAQAPMVNTWRACYVAAQPYVMKLLHLAGAGPNDVRLMAPMVLATLGRRATKVVGNLRELILSEDSAYDVRASRVWALGMLSDPQLPTVSGFLKTIIHREDSPVVALVAAMVVARNAPNETSPVVFDELRRGLGACCALSPAYNQLPFTASLPGDVASVVCRASPAQARAVLQPLLGALAGADHGDLYEIVRAATHLLAGADADAAHVGREALLAESAIWESRPITSLLASRGYPGERKAFARAFGFDSSESPDTVPPRPVSMRGDFVPDGRITPIPA